MAPGMLLPDGISQFGQGTFESVYAYGYWVFTKGGLTVSMGTSIAIVPELKLGVTVMFNINSGIDSDKLNSEIMRLLIPAVVDALKNNQEPLPLPPNYETFLGSYGYSTPYFTLQETSDTQNTGVFTGQVLGVGEVDIIWDESQNYGDYTAFRYSSTSKYKSCMSQSSIGNNAIAYLSIVDGKPHCTLADQNASFYDLPLMK